MWRFVRERTCEVSWSDSSFRTMETTEIKSRIRAAWASFTKYRQELTSKAYLLRHRLHLFNMVITLTLTSRMITKNLSDRHNARCFASQFRQSENIRTMLKNNEEKTTKSDEEPTNDEQAEEKMNAAKTRKERQKKVSAQSQVATKTAKSLSWETPMKTLTQLKLKKIGSNT